MAIKRRCSALSVLLMVFLVLTPARGQQIPFLSELLSRYEAFNKLYVEKRRAGVSLSAIEPLRARGEAAFRSGNIPAVLETLGEAIAALEGKTWSEKRKFEASLTLETDRLVLEPNQTLQASLVRMFPSNDNTAFSARPTVTFEIKLGALTPQSDRTALTSPQRLPKQTIIAERLQIGETTTSANERLLLPDGSYRLVARIESGGEKIAEIGRPVYAISDFNERISELSAQVAQIKESSDPKVKAVAHLLPTPEFQLERLASLTGSPGDQEINPIVELDRVEGMLSALAKGSDAVSSYRGEVEKAYRASDRKLVPYRVYVPKSYTPAHPAPLVVMLHGALGDERSYFSGLYDATLVRGEAERRGFILAAPNGRGRFSGYQGPGEEDVLEVIKAVTRDYNVNPNRVYLTGHSMGGFGTWLIASHRPELFAAIAPVSGWSPVPPNELPALLERLKPVPILTLHGGRDGIVPPSQSRSMVAAARKAGLTVEYLESAESDHVTVVAATLTRVMDFFDAHKKSALAK